LARKKMWLIGIVVRFTEFLFLISFTSVTIITRFSNTLIPTESVRKVCYNALRGEKRREREQK